MKCYSTMCFFLVYNQSYFICQPYPTEVKKTRIRNFLEIFQIEKPILIAIMRPMTALAPGNGLF